MESEKYNVTGMTCAACSAHVEKAVRGVSGVTSVSVNLLMNTMLVGYEAPATEALICQAVEKAGYGAIPVGAATGKRANDSIAGSGASKSDMAGGSRTVDGNGMQDVFTDRETPKLRKRLIASLCLLIPLMYVSMGHLMWGWPVPAAFAENPGRSHSISFC